MMEILLRALSKANFLGLFNDFLLAHSFASSFRHPPTHVVIESVAKATSLCVYIST